MTLFVQFYTFFFSNPIIFSSPFDFPYLAYISCFIRQYLVQSWLFSFLPKRLVWVFCHTKKKNRHLAKPPQAFWPCIFSHLAIRVELVHFCWPWKRGMDRTDFSCVFFLLPTAALFSHVSIFGMMVEAIQIIHACQKRAGRTLLSFSLVTLFWFANILWHILTCHAPFLCFSSACLNFSTTAVFGQIVGVGQLGSRWCDHGHEATGQSAGWPHGHRKILPKAQKCHPLIELQCLPLLFLWCFLWRTFFYIVYSIISDEKAVGLFFTSQRPSFFYFVLGGFF